MSDPALRSSLLLLVLLASRPAAQSGPGDDLLTTAEASGFERTSTHADVLVFLRRLEELPRGDRLVRSTLGQSGGGRDLALVLAADPPLADAAAVLASGKLRILVNANIHGGEVEGKEATLMLLREIANGEHGAIFERTVLLFVPDFNPDGNDAISTENRRSQNGPPGGVGERENAAGLDLNRDFVKARSPEVRGLLGALRAYDPHLLLDLHTTNGSHHGYHLTYAPSLSTNVDPALARFAREAFLPEVRKVLADQGLRTFDYGNFSRRGERVWSTFDHRPRFGTNYQGVRNRLAVLSEAYSYLGFEQRVRATHAFVLENLRAAVRHAAEIERLCAAADRSCATADGVALPFATEMEPATPSEVLVGSAHRDGDRWVADEAFKRVTMPVRAGFRSAQQLALPLAWAILQPPAEVLDNLRLHGIEVERLTKAAACDAEVFVPSAVEQVEYEGLQTTRLQGALERRRVELPAGTLLVRRAQRLARLAAQLLEAQSEDSLALWNFFAGQIAVPEAAAPAGGAPPYPVVRLIDPPALETAKVPP